MFFLFIIIFIYLFIYVFFNLFYSSDRNATVGREQLQECRQDREETVHSSWKGIRSCRNNTFPTCNDHYKRETIVSSFFSSRRTECDARGSRIFFVLHYTNERKSSLTFKLETEESLANWQKKRSTRSRKFNHLWN